MSEEKQLPGKEASLKTEPEKKCKMPDVAVEFQPDALEIKQERLPWWARHSIFLFAILGGGAILWACVGKVDVIVQAQGKLVTDKQNVVMKPVETTVIKSVNVKVGEIVKKDQILITFDPTINMAEAAKYRSEVSILQAQFDRLVAEFRDKPYTVSAKPTQDELWQLAIYTQRHQYFQEKMKYYEQNIQQISASEKSKRDSVTKQSERLVLIRKIEDMYKELHQKNITSMKDMLSVSIQRMEMEFELDQLKNALLELEHQKKGTEANRDSFVEEWKNNISEKMVEARRDFVTSSKQYEKVMQMVSYVHLRSPCEAMVHEIAAFSAGSAVREAEALITLVPLDGKVELEAELDPKDIGKVEIGSQVRIKLNAYPFQKHGTLDGVVRSISEDTFQKQQGEPGTVPFYYRARITVSGKLDRVKSHFRLIPGMEVQAEIKTGRRRIIEYLIYPLIKALDETAREP